jgi:hypothetical protein
MYKAKVAVWSEIRTKHINAMSLQCKNFECQTRCYVKCPLGFKSLIWIKPVAARGCPDRTFSCVHYFSARKSDDDVSGSFFFRGAGGFSSLFPRPPHPTSHTPQPPSSKTSCFSEYPFNLTFQKVVWAGMNGVWYQIPSGSAYVRVGTEVAHHDLHSVRVGGGGGMGHYK